VFGAKRVTGPATKASVSTPTPSASLTVEAVTAAVIAALTSQGIVPALTAKPSEKPIKAVLVRAGALTAKPSAKVAKSGKVKASAAPAKPERPAHLATIARFDDRAAKAAGVDKSTPITAENVGIVAEYVRSMYPKAEYTSLGGAKTAVRQILRVQGRLTHENLLTAWNAVKADFR